MEQGKPIDALTGYELTALLKWHGVEKPGDGKVAQRRDKWMKIVEERRVPPSVREWSIDEEAYLTMLEAEPILIKENALGCL